MKVAYIFTAYIILAVCSFGGMEAESNGALSRKVQFGIAAGEKILGLLKFEETSKILSQITKLASSIGPFLGALGPIMSLITMFIPLGDSPELKLMKKKFAEVDANFGKVFNRFSEIKNLIQETSLKNQFSDYEAKILALSRRLQLVLNAPVGSAESKEVKKTFIEYTKSSYDNAAFVIWNGMMGKGHGFQYDIPKEAIKYTNNNRGKVQEIMKGGLSLIIQGVKVQLAYLSLTGRNHSYESEKNEWNVKIKAVLERMKEIDNEVVSKWQEQAKKDAVAQMAEFKDKSNAALANKLYTLLTGKFDWRLWIVVVYDDDLDINEEHYVSTCNGFYKFNHHGKNIAVASNDKKKLPLDRSCAGAELQATQTKRDTYIYLTAKDIVELAFPPEYKDCTAPGHGAIRKTANVEFRGPPGRYVVRVNNYWKLFAFQ